MTYLHEHTSFSMRKKKASLFTLKLSFSFGWVFFFQTDITKLFDIIALCVSKTLTISNSIFIIDMLCRWGRLVNGVPQSSEIKSKFDKENNDKCLILESTDVCKKDIIVLFLSSQVLQNWPSCERCTIF